VAKKIEEGHGAIAYNYHYGPNSNGVHSRRGGSMASWSEKQMNDMLHLRNMYHGGGKSTPTLRVNETILTRQAVTLTDREIPRGAQGRVVEQTAEGLLKLDFGKWGSLTVSPEVAASKFEVVPGDSIRESLARGLAKGYQVRESLRPGARVKDAQGNQYFVEQGDVFGRRFQVMNTQGQPKIIEGIDLERLDESTPFTEDASIANTPLPPGSKVVVTTIDPVHNSLRRYGVAPGEAGGIVGQQGVLEFAFYPSAGVPVYRVLLQNGGRKDFTVNEIQPVA